MINKEYYRMSLEEVIKCSIKGSRAERAYKKIIYTTGWDNASDIEKDLIIALYVAQTWVIKRFILPMWYATNHECGGLLDLFDDGRRNKRLKNLCNTVVK